MSGQTKEDRDVCAARHNDAASFGRNDGGGEIRFLHVGLTAFPLRGRGTETPCVSVDEAENSGGGGEIRFLHVGTLTGRTASNARKAARCLSFRPSTGWSKFPSGTMRQPCVPRCAASAVTKTRGGENHSPDGFPSPFESLPNDDKQNGYRMVPVLFVKDRVKVHQSIERRRKRHRRRVRQTEPYRVSFIIYAFTTGRMGGDISERSISSQAKNRSSSISPSVDFGSPLHFLQIKTISKLETSSPFG